jgi:hypothetical protein
VDSYGIVGCFAEEEARPEGPAKGLKHVGFHSGRGKRPPDGGRPSAPGQRLHFIIGKVGPPGEIGTWVGRGRSRLRPRARAVALLADSCLLNGH